MNCRQCKTSCDIRLVIVQPQQQKNAQEYASTHTWLQARLDIHLDNMTDYSSVTRDENVQ